MAFQQVPAPVSLVPALEQKGHHGRPNLLDNSPEIREAILQYIEEGLAFSEACSLAGVSRQTLYNYMQSGAANIRKEDYEQENAQFYLLVKQAEAQSELNSLKKINNAANIPAFWGAAAFLLERRYPDRYGKQDRLTVQSTSRIDIQTTNVESNIIDAESRTIINEFAKLTIPSESESVDAIPGAFSPLPDDGEIPIP